jgi:glutathione S-transferase
VAARRGVCKAARPGGVSCRIGCGDDAGGGRRVIEIVGRQSSHYTRLVRMFAHELDVPYRLVPIFDLLSTDPAVFAGNPALKLPALHDGDAVVWGSGNACRWIARVAADGDARVAWPEHSTDALAMNAHELVAHAMAVEVEVVFHEIVSKRPPDAASIKRRESLENCLDWLDAHLDAVRSRLPDAPVRWIELALFCLLEHLPFRNPVDLSTRPSLRDFVAEFADRPSALATPFRFDTPPPAPVGDTAD